MGKVIPAKGRVFTNMEYAVHQEFGFTVRSKSGGTWVPAQPFLRPALDLQKKQILKDLKGYVNSELLKHKVINLLPFVKEATRRVEARAVYLVPVSVRRGIQAPKGVRERGSKKGEAIGGALRDSIKSEAK